MKTNIKYLAALFIILITGAELQAQYGYGRGYGRGYGSGYGYGSRYGYGQGRRGIPQMQETKKEPENLTAEEIVDKEMPGIAEALDLNAFEIAVMTATLKKYLQERIEMQILKLPPEKMREGMEKILEQQDADLKAGLPIEKYDAFVALQKKGVAKTQKEKKKKEKKKKKRNKKTDKG